MPTAVNYASSGRFARYLKRAMTLSYETLHVACFPVGVRYRRRT
ncbi:hypothetical protein [Nostoc sp.]